MKVLRIFPLLAVCVLLFASCSEDEDNNVFDSYQNWYVRNVEWYANIADTARTEIAKAKASHGDNWEEYTPWRMYLTISLDSGRDLSDTVIVRMVKSCPEAARPLYNDTVRINYRGWLMPTTYRIDGRDEVRCQMFDQSFYGKYGPYEYTAFNDATARPSKGATNSYVEGFATALQYMREGEQAHVYIPCVLGYGVAGNGTIPGGSVLHFFLHLRAVYPVGTPVPEWK